MLYDHDNYYRKLYHVQILVTYLLANWGQIPDILPKVVDKASKMLILFVPHPFLKLLIIIQSPDLSP